MKLTIAITKEGTSTIQLTDPEAIKSFIDAVSNGWVDDYLETYTTSTELETDITWSISE